MIHLDPFPQATPPQIDATAVPVGELLSHRTLLTSQLCEDPYRPLLWYQRAVIYRRLGYPDLCVGDAYRALGLLDGLEDAVEADEDGSEANGDDGEEDGDGNELENGVEGVIEDGNEKETPQKKSSPRISSWMPASLQSHHRQTSSSLAPTL